LCFQYKNYAQSLLRTTPEAQGVSSEGILHFLDAAAKSKTEFHSFMLLRHGKVIAEGWWNPYRADLRHSLYSCSKSFTATAVGFAIAEKKLSLSDKVISFFPEYLPDSVSKNLSQLSIKDALMMADGMAVDPSFLVAAKDTNWIKGFFIYACFYLSPALAFSTIHLALICFLPLYKKLPAKKLLTI